MILLDTSVLIDFLKGKNNNKVLLLEKAVSKNCKIYITPLVFTEVLMGTKTEREYSTLKTILSRFPMLNTDADISFYENSALLYRKCRTQGITVRSIIDIMIAETAVSNHLLLLHNDKDYSHISKVEPKLKFLEKL